MGTSVISDLFWCDLGLSGRMVSHVLHGNGTYVVPVERCLLPAIVHVESVDAYMWK